MPQKRALSRQLDVAKLILVPKPGKEADRYPSKYRPISLLNTQVKVLEKLLIQRIMIHAYTIEAIKKSVRVYAAKVYSGCGY